MNKKIIVLICICIVGYFSFLKIKPKIQQLNYAINTKIAKEQEINSVHQNVSTTYTQKSTIDNTNIDSNIEVSDLQFNRYPENVEIEVLKDSISRKSATIVVTDTNED